MRLFSHENQTWGGNEHEHVKVELDVDNSNWKVSESKNHHSASFLLFSELRTVYGKVAELANSPVPVCRLFALHHVAFTNMPRDFSRLVLQ